MTAFPNAPELQTRLARVKHALLDELEHRHAATVQEAIDLLNVVRRIDSYTTEPLPNPSPVLPGFPFTP
jgi:hypothetical protein